MNQFEHALKALSEAGVEFVVIGGVAIAAYGSAYVTFDLDVCYRRTPENIQRLKNALAPHHPRLRGASPDLPFRLDVPTLSRGLNFTLTTDLGDLDLFGEVPGIGSFDAVLTRCRVIELFGRRCSVLSLDGLIASKRAAGRPRDLAVLPELEALSEIEILRSAGAKRTTQLRDEGKQSGARGRKQKQRHE